MLLSAADTDNPKDITGMLGYVFANNEGRAKERPFCSGTCALRKPELVVCNVIRALVKMTTILMTLFVTVTVMIIHNDNIRAMRIKVIITLLRLIIHGR